MKPVFGWITRSTGGQLTRKIGLERTEARRSLKKLTFNCVVNFSTLLSWRQPTQYSMKDSSPSLNSPEESYGDSWFSLNNVICHVDS
jgi:hypothetical protein